MKREVVKECDGRRAGSCEDSREGSTANLQTRQNKNNVVRTCRENQGEKMEMEVEMGMRSAGL